MNDLPKLYFTMQTYLFSMLEEKLGELPEKMKAFLQILEMVRPSQDREKMLRGFLLKAVYDFPTAKG